MAPNYDSISAQEADTSQCEQTNLTILMSIQLLDDVVSR